MSIDTLCTWILLCTLSLKPQLYYNAVVLSTTGMSRGQNMQDGATFYLFFTVGESVYGYPIERLTGLVGHRRLKKIRGRRRKPRFSSNFSEAYMPPYRLDETYGTHSARQNTAHSYPSWWQGEFLSPGKFLRTSSREAHRGWRNTVRLRIRQRWCYPRVWAYNMSCDKVDADRISHYFCVLFQYWLLIHIFVCQFDNNSVRLNVKHFSK